MRRPRRLSTLRRAGARLLACVAVVASTARLGAQPLDPRIGSWTLVRVEVEGVAVAPPRSVWVYTEKDGMLRLSVRSDGSGPARVWSYSTRLDGQAVAVTGNPAVSRALVRRMEDGSHEFVYFERQGTQVHGRNVLSADGAEMTVTQRGSNGRTSVGVYRRRK